jgi:zinc protease
MSLLTLLPFPTICQTQQYALDNGLNIIVKEDHRAPIAVSMIWYNVGSADEPGGITGISHAIEHLMFKGTPKYPLGQFSKTIASLGGQENAMTSNDYTLFYEKIASQHLAICFKLEADRMQNLLLDPDEFAKEIKVIQEERRLRTDDNPQALTFERFLATAHLATPYHHPVIGWMNDLQRLPIGEVKTWYQRFYAPNNATLVVVGDVHPNEVYQLAKKYFGPLKTRAPIKHRAPTEPPRLGKKTVEVHAHAQVPMLMLGFTVPSIKTVSANNAADPYALELIGALLDAGESGRLNTQLIHQQQIASGVDVFYNIYARYPTQFILYGTPSHSRTTSELKKGILTELNRLKSTPVDNKELQRVKTQIIAEKTFEKDSIFGQAMELGLLETLGAGWQTSEKYIERMNQITALQIQKAAQRYFKHNEMTEAVLIPIKHTKSSLKPKKS